MSAHPSSSLPRYRSSRRVAAAALVNIRSMTPARLRALLTTWPDPRDAAAAVARRDPRVLEVLRELRVGGRTDVGELVTHWSRNIDIDRVAATLARRGTHVFLWSEPDYPIADQLPNRPAVLLAEGQELEALDAPRVAVVGTRAASPHGLHDAFELGAFLARAGCTVVSGMAIGVDAAAHEGALDAGGRAVGVIATGLDIVYPRRHHVLFERAKAHGCLISESAFATLPEPGRFPVRNRIIAGLADAVVVVEATLKGGARITAERGLEYGRPVLAVPGSRRNASAAGCNALLADGAHPLLDPSDVLVALGMTPGARRGWVRRPRTTGDAQRCLQACGGEPATIDQLASRTVSSPATWPVRWPNASALGRSAASEGSCGRPEARDAARRLRIRRADPGYRLTDGNATPKGDDMATQKQKEAARRNLVKARQAQSARAHGKQIPRRAQGMSTAEENRLRDQEFAFPDERKEPLTDAAHVRNAIARFDQVEGVTDAERDRAWKRIVAAAKRYDVDVSARDWRDLFEGGRARKQ